MRDDFPGADLLPTLMIEPVEKPWSSRFAA